jgi:hypothetical protein
MNDSVFEEDLPNSDQIIDEIDDDDLAYDDVFNQVENDEKDINHYYNTTNNKNNNNNVIIGEDKTSLVEDNTHSSEQIIQNENSNNEDYSYISNTTSDNLYIDYEDDTYNNQNDLNKMNETEPCKK